MPKFICRNPDGSTQFDINSRIAKIVGSFSIPNTDGQFNTGIISPESIWFYCNSSNNMFMYAPPKIEINSSTGVISWRWLSPNTFPPTNTFLLVFGRY